VSFPFAYLSRSLGGPVDECLSFFIWVNDGQSTGWLDGWMDGSMDSSLERSRVCGRVDYSCLSFTFDGEFAFS
jgi:hypothetical protein